MKRNSIVVACICLLMAFMASPVAAAEWILRLRAISVAPGDDSGTILTTGTGTSVESDVVPELDLTLMLAEKWGLELIVATTKHDIDTSGGILGGSSAGNVGVLPPTLTLQYHFSPDGIADFYLGGGVNYTTFYGYETSSFLKGAGVSDIDFDDSFGPAGQAGVDFAFNERWRWNLDVKYILMSTNAALKLNDGSELDTIEVELDPWVVGTGIGITF